MAKKLESKSRRQAWSDDWSVGVRVTVDRRGEIVLDQSVADLLIELDRTGSISAAAKKVGVSYRHAWLMLQRANDNSNAPLFEATIGGCRGGGTRLTDHGRKTLSVFQQVQRQISSAAAKSLPRIVSSDGREAIVVHLAAAISLQEALAQVLDEYALTRPTIRVRTIFGASNELADQIVSGATIDVFLSANARHISRLAKAKLLDPKSRRKLVSNSLAVVGPQAFIGKVHSPADLHTVGEAAIIVADPACPLGECTADFFKSAGLLQDLDSRLQLAENSRAVVAALRSKDSRMGIVFESDLQNLVGATLLYRIPASKAKTVYEGAVVARSAVLEEATALLRFLESKEAQACFQRCGFTV